MLKLKTRHLLSGCASLALIAGVLTSAPAYAAATCAVSSANELTNCWNTSAAGATIKPTTDITLGSSSSDRLGSRSGAAKTIDLNGHALVVPKGITVDVGDDLTIDDQSSNHNGSLTVNDVDDYHAGIGGYNWRNGHITIKNGTVNVTGSSEAAAIGGGDNDSGASRIVISGGTVRATGGGYGAGIGGSKAAEAGTVVITGGTVTAIGGYGAAAIGSGSDSPSTGGSTNISISGGTVNSFAGVGGAGIGSGDTGHSPTVSISGGTVFAVGDGGGAGIGGGANSDGGTVSITNGAVKARSETDTGVGVGGGYGASSSGTLSVGGTRPNPVPPGFIDTGGPGADTAGNQLPNISYAVSGSKIAITRVDPDVESSRGSLWVVFEVLPPAVATVSPSSGSISGGTSITITGTNLDDVTGITVGGQPCTNIRNNTSTAVTCTVPAHAAGSVAVVVTTAGGSATKAGGFTYSGTPTSARPGKPKKAATKGVPTAKKFVVRWSSVRGTAAKPVSGYRVRVNVRGCSTVFYTKKLNKKRTSITFTRSFLLKHSHCKRNVRGEVAPQFVNYRARIQAYNAAGYGKAAVATIKVRREVDPVFWTGVLGGVFADNGS